MVISPLSMSLVISSISSNLSWKRELGLDNVAALLSLRRLGFLFGSNPVVLENYFSGLELLN
jgi:hypothetical protein